MRALVLSGGGALGAFEAGAIQALSDNHDEFDIVCGTSIGAINAAFAAQDKIPQLTSLWQRIGTLDPPVIDYFQQVQFAIDLADEFEKIAHLNPFGIEPFVKRWTEIGSKKAFLALRGFVRPNAIETILSSNLEFTTLKRSLIVTATDLTRGASEAFYAFVGANCDSMQRSFTAAFGDGAHQLTTNENLALAVRASAAIPGAFEPVAMNLGSAGNKDFVDGGVANNVPVTLAAYAGATDISVILLQPFQTAPPSYPTTNLLDIGMASFTVMQQTLLQQDMQRVNKTPNVTVRYISPATPLPLTVLSFTDQSGIDQAFAAGMAAARASTPLGKPKE
jgi:predicted acylesterase/phospholipase RssA